MIWLLFIAAAVVQLLYYLFFFSRVALFKKKEPQEKVFEPVSVVICAKNEAENLKINLPKILEQNYPDYEVIVVNDGSNDNTQFVLHELHEHFTHLKIIELKPEEKHLPGKKAALKKGIAAAAYNYILLTDADCRPAGRNWIAVMAQNFSEGIDIVLGYGANECRNSLLNSFFRFEIFYTALQYFSFALAGIPYMGVGRNLAYKKAVFLEKEKFHKEKHLPSGDDDLFINKAATGVNTAVELNPESFTFSPAKTTFKEWLRQKKRHLSTGRHYRWFHLLLLSLLAISHVIFYLSLITLIISGWELYTVFGWFFGRMFLQLLVFFRSMKKLGEADLFLLSPLWDFLYTLFYLILAPWAAFNKQHSWE